MREPHIQHLLSIDNFLNYYPVQNVGSLGNQVMLSRTFYLGQSVVQLSEKIVIAEDVLMLIEQENRCHTNIFDIKEDIVCLERF